jgi:hypothetical protein
MNFQFLIFKKSEDMRFELMTEGPSSEGVGRRKTSYRAFLLVLILFLTIPLTIHAQQVSLAISPPLLEVFIKPGKSIMVAYQLQNFADPTILSAQVLPFEPKDNLGNIRIKEEFEGPIRFSLDNADIQLNQPFFLKTGDSQQLLLRVRVPDGAPDGDYYYTLLAQTQPPPTVEGVAGGRASAMIGSNILITVTGSGLVDVKGKIALFDVLPRWKFKVGSWKFNIFDSNDKIPVVLIVENRGKNLIKPEGEIVLRGNFGEKAKYEILPQNILAQSQRLLTATPSAEIEGFHQPISLLLSGFFLGRYNLSTTVNFGEVSPNIFASSSFVAVPFKLIFGFSLALFITTLVVKRITKKDD